MQHALIVAAVVLMVGAQGVLRADEQALPQLKVFHRSGQTFVVWHQVGGAEVTYNLYRADAPITTATFAEPELVATRIPQGTGVDFIAQNVARFWKQEAPATNFTAVADEGPLPEGTGLFVYTPKVERTSFYAMTAVWPEDGEDRRVQIGINSQPEQVVEGTAPAAPILTGSEREKDVVRLEYLHWATSDLASVDGFPYRFRVVVKEEEQGASGQGLIVRLHPYTGNYSQTKWTEPGFLSLGPDDFTPPVSRPPYHHSFWSGYREDAGTCYLTGASAERAGGACRWTGEHADDVPVRDYTRRRILWTVAAVIREFHVDEEQVHLTGSSMGGGGTVRLGVIRPDLFASLDANVPPLPKREYVLSIEEDLPLLKFFNARQDNAIRWGQVPPFIRAIQEARQPFVCAWDNGGHGGPHPDIPPLFKAFDVHEMRRNRCVPAFANASTAEDPGSGDAEDGDIVGSINDDFRWSVERDDESELVLRLWRLPKPGKFAEVEEATVDVTPRRRQGFRPEPGTQVTFRNLSAADGSVVQEMTLTVEPSGLFTAPKVRVGLEPGSRLVFTTAEGASANTP